MDTNDKKVYIIDNEYNYYKLNSKGQLAQAACMEEASIFSLHDAKSRIGSGKKGRRFDFMAVPEPAIKEPVMLNTAIKDQSETPKKVNDEMGFDYSTIFQCDQEGLVRKLCQMADHIEDHKKSLLSKLSILDQQRSDILHYVEFMNLNAEQHAEASRMLQERCRARREIKNELARLDMMTETFMDPTFSIMIHQSLEKMEDMKNWHYNPRQMPELFKGVQHFSNVG